MGWNFDGQLGDGTFVNKSVPAQVPGLTGITSIAGGWSQSLFLKNNGTAWAVGSNFAGQLGNGTTVDETTVVQVTNLCSMLTGVQENLIENNFGNNLTFFTNPNDGDFSIDLGGKYQTITITMTDLVGKIIQAKTYNESQLLNLKIEESAVIYKLVIESKDKKAVIKLVKE